MPGPDVDRMAHQVDALAGAGDVPVDRRPIARSRPHDVHELRRVRVGGEVERRRELSSSVSAPGLYIPSVSGQEESAAIQVWVFTGMLTMALAVPPLAQVSATPSPTVMSMAPELSGAGPRLGHSFCGTLQPFKL